MYESQRLEPLAGSTGLLALVHTTRLTGGYDFLSETGKNQDFVPFFAAKSGSRNLFLSLLTFSGGNGASLPGSMGRLAEKRQPFRSDAAR